MKLISTFVFYFIFINVIFSQNKEIDEVKEFQSKLTADYKDPDHSPLKGEKLNEFQGHEFFPIDLNYRVIAKFKKDKGKVFGMKTSTSRMAQYKKYGTLSFEINGETFKLNVYQSESLKKSEEYKDYLFLPFMDQTNGNTTYGAGRYIDLSIPKGKTIVVDFNKAYNPYCAYTEGYSCPIPPQDNFLNTEIKAGIKSPKKAN
ncbi:DUF1684 domain-containing protein [Flammeovirga sp. MY04]|uniref:DUF1684 domain-containing protein n=1 Tax=Flammeovirga sp. MY04 TaxID=1191459 RepID=UPI000806133D|nr:DUF1684 domain-containing protein [Flammeovirga sp. MY04]ANQ52052.1 DUF1684 domain-containing protein [Flammeovirga sp. MY04]